MIEATTELTQALRDITQAEARLFNAGEIRERPGEAWKDFVAAFAALREATLAKATPLPAGDAHKNR